MGLDERSDHDAVRKDAEVAGRAATASVSGREVGVGDLPRSLRRATLCLCSFKVWGAGYAVVHPRPRLQQRS